MNRKITFIGSGAMATAMAKVAHDSGNKNITIYGVDEQELNELKKGKNTKYFPIDSNIPSFRTTDDLAKAVNKAEYIVLAVPSKFMKSVVDSIEANITEETLLINVAKGFYPGTSMSLHEGLKKQTNKNSLVRGVVSLIGPSHAEEIVKEIPTIISVVDKDKKLIEEVQQLFINPYFKTYMQTDVKGAEVGAAYKNVLAIASGISEGLGYGINTTAALLTRGLAEMQRFNKAMHGKKETIYGLTGIGDLIVTATSDLSRNYTFGKQLANNGKKALETKTTVEGLNALDFIYKIGQEKKVSLPIVEYLYKVIHNDLSMHDLVKSLWDRDLKSE